MAKFVNLGDLLAVAVDDVAAFSQGVDRYEMREDGTMAEHRDLRIWLKSSDWSYEQREFILPDKGGELFAKLQRAMEAG